MFFHQTLEMVKKMKFFLARRPRKYGLHPSSNALKLSGVAFLLVLFFLIRFIEMLHALNKENIVRRQRGYIRVV